MKYPSVICATAALVGLLAAGGCDDDDDDDQQVTPALRPTSSAGSTGMSTGTAGRGGGAGSSSTGSAGGDAGDGSAGDGSAGDGSAGAPGTGAAGTSATGGGGASGVAVADAGTEGTLPDLPGDAGVANLSDGQIVTVVDTLNAGEVAQAQAALPRLSDESLLAFATDMVNEHGTARQDLQAFAQMQGITPAPSDVAADLAERSAVVVEALNGATAETVDDLYIESQVGAHLEALTLLEQMIEVVDAQPLEGQLILLRGSVDAHLNRARELNQGR